MNIKILLICLVFVFFTVSTLVGETITITTYYPSPQGNYLELRSERVAIGYTDISDACWIAGCGTDISDNASRNVDLIVEGSVGIGMVDPQTSLDVAGGIKVGTVVLCDATRDGTFRWEAVRQEMQICINDNWWEINVEQATCTIGDTRTNAYKNCSCGGAGSLIWEGTVDQQCQDTDGDGVGEWRSVDYHCCPVPPEITTPCVCDP